MAAFNSVTVPFQKGKDLCNTQGVKFKEASAEFRDRAKRGRRLPRLAIPLSAGRGFGGQAEVGVHRLAVRGAGTPAGRTGPSGSVSPPRRAGGSRGMHDSKSRSSPNSLAGAVRAESS